MEKKLDLIIERIHNIEKTMDRNTVSLEHHVKRTDLLEHKIEMWEDEYKKDIEPIKSHVALMSSVFKIIIFLSIVVGIIKNLH